MRICKRDSSANTKVSVEEEEGDAPEARAEIPLQPVVQIVVKQDVPLQPVDIHSGAHIHLQPVEDPNTRAGGCPKEAVTLWEACAGTGS